MTIREVDILTDDDGDLVVAANGDLDLADAARTAMQDIVFRVRTQHQDYNIHPLIGANLSALFGEPNSVQNGDRIKAQVFRALTRDGRFRDTSLNIEVVPVATDEVVLLVGISDFIANAEEDTIVAAAFNLNYQEGTLSLLR